MDDKQIIELLMNTLHDIGGAYYARRALGSHHLTAPLRASMESKAFTDEAIEKLALDTWEMVAMAMAEREAVPR